MGTSGRKSAHSVGASGFLSRGPFLTTKEMTGRARAEQQTAIASLCRKGNYLGIVPVKLPNGRLLWPEDEVERVLSGEFVK